MWFEYQIFSSWICNRIHKIVTEGDAPDLKHLLKIAFYELREKLPTFVKDIAFAISMPVSQAVCETMENSKDGLVEEVGMNDKSFYPT